jgi:hypothetical protein
MKFSQMTEEQQDAIRETFLTVISVRSQEEQRYTEQFFLLLVLGNGTGVFLLATFMGALVTTNKAVGSLRVPLILFSIGAFLAAFVYVPLTAVANQATVNAFQQITDFFLDKKELEAIQPYGFNRRGLFIVWSLLLLSFLAFGVALIVCIRILGRL